MTKCREMEEEERRRRQWYFSGPRYSGKIFLLYYPAWAEPKMILWNVHHLGQLLNSLTVFSVARKQHGPEW